MRIPSLGNIGMVAAGESHSLALDKQGKVWAWGHNADGQLGDGSQTDRLSPGAVPGLPPVSMISARGMQSFALTGDGQIWAWGQNSEGQLGLGHTTSPIVTPARIANVDKVVKIAAGDRNTIALRRDGTLWTWGRNFEGQAGDGSFAQRTSPGLALAPGGSSVFDLDDMVENEIPTGTLPPFRLQAMRKGDSSALSLSTKISGALALASARQRSGDVYNIYVAAQAGSGSLNWYQLDANQSWRNLAWPMDAFLSGTSIGAIDQITIEILEEADVSSLVGSHVYVGYGLDADEMLTSQRYREVYTVSP
jgi:hypothetical protein